MEKGTSKRTQRRFQLRLAREFVKKMRVVEETEEDRAVDGVPDIPSPTESPSPDTADRPGSGE